MPPRLRVIDGGGDEGGGRQRRRRRRQRKHWLADPTFSALAETPRATNMDEVHRRVCRILRRPQSTISIAQVNHAMHVVRGNPEFYQWGVCYVGKGPYDEKRRYVPVLADFDAPGPDGEPYTYWDDDDNEYIKWGAVSGSREAATRCRNLASGLEMAIPMQPVEDRRRFRKLVAALEATAEIADQAVGKALRLVS